MNVGPVNEETILEQALSFGSVEARRAYLRGACAGDDALYARVESLITAHEAAAGFLREEPARPPAAIRAGLSAEEELGAIIGRYKLLERVGEGGCGVVYVAEQQEPVRRRVALKVIKLGMDTKEVVARFEAERQALALMDHPNIAKVLDAGATGAGRPYFAMELVRGVRLTHYCDQNNLSTRERLDLFIKVCQAIQHAHQKGIIHRDIKPSNILVTLHDGVPVPKVIDFGIAKATTDQRLTDKTIYTALEQFIGTPAYMSPEQAEMSGLDIDTRSDIYSLGVLLYELLTGKTPFDARQLLAAGLDEMRRTIREQEPMRPSTRLRTMLEGELTTTAKQRRTEPPKLIHMLRGDLDWIVLKALEKDRTRRYETANGLARDVQRHLNHEPVGARPPSPAYRFQKLVRRNRLVFVAAMSVFLALLAGLAISTWALLRERQARAGEAKQRRRAEEQGELANQRTRKAQENELLARKNLYAQEMLLACQAFEEGNLRLTGQLLNKYRPAAGSSESGVAEALDLRGWEWRMLWQQSTRRDELFILRGHTNASEGAALLDGHTVVALGGAGDLWFWDLNSPAAWPQTISLGIGSSRDYSVLTQSPDGRLLALGGDQGWALWDITKRRLAQTSAAGGANGLAFSPDSQKLAVSVGAQVQIVDTATGQTNHIIERKPGYFGDAFVNGVAFSSDGRTVAYGHSGDQLALCDLRSDSIVPLGRTLYQAVLSLSFSPNGRFLAAADRGGINIWDPVHRVVLKTLTSHLTQVICVVFSPDGKLLASASGDNTIKLWDTVAWEERETLHGHEGEVYAVAFSPDGQRLLSTGPDQTVRIWSADLAQPKLEHRSLAAPRADWFRLHVPGVRSVIVHGNWQAISFLDRLTLHESAPQAIPQVVDQNGLFEFGRNGALLATSRTNGLVEVWQTQPFQRLCRLEDSKLPVRGLALNERADRLAVLRSDETIELWNLESRRLAHRLPALPNTFPTFIFQANDQCLLRLAPGEKIEVWFLRQGVKYELRGPWRTSLNSVALSHNGELLATSGWDGAVKLWAVKSDQLLDTFGGQLAGFTTVAFSNDDSRLAGGGYDGKVTLWDLTTQPHRQVAQWRAARRWCHWLEFTDDDTGLFTAAEPTDVDGRWQTVLRHWPAPKLTEIETQLSKGSH